MDSPSAEDARRSEDDASEPGGEDGAAFEDADEILLHEVHGILYNYTEDPSSASSASKVWAIRGAGTVKLLK